MRSGPSSEAALVAWFQGHDTRPTGVWDYPASIPLVGRLFVPGQSLMVYASAENLSWMAKDSDKPHSRYFLGDYAWNRYRHQFDDQDLSNGEFFPWVGIQPFTNGALACAARYVCQKSGLGMDENPRAFVEHIAVTNWCKFSERSEVNCDPVGNRELRIASLPYVEEELRTLRPRLVMLPQSIWDKPRVATAMEKAAPQTRFLLVKQFNATVVNCMMEHHDSKAAEIRAAYSGSTFEQWMLHIRRVNKTNAWRYLAHLDEALSDPSF